MLRCSTLIPHSRNLHISKNTTDRFNKVRINFSTHNFEN